MGAKSKRSKSVEISSWLMLTPQVIGFILFSLCPLIYILRYSFFDFDGVTAVWCGIDNFIKVFSDSIYWASLRNTFIFCFAKLIIEIPLALALAVFLNSKLKGRSFARGLFFMPNVLSTAVVALIFSILFASYNGYVNNVLMALGFIDAPISFLGQKWTAFGLIIFVSIWQNFGVNMLLLFSGLQGISEEVYECSALDGATGWVQFRKITVPMLMPVLKIVLMLAIIGSMTVTDLVLVLTGGGPVNDTNVAMLYIYQKFFGDGSGASDIGYASALGVVTAIILWTIVFVYKKITNEIDQMSD